MTPATIQVETRHSDIEKINASATPQAFICPGSIRRASLMIDEEVEAAALGTTAHIAFRTLAETGTIDWYDLPRLASEHGVDLEELRMLCAQATNLWKEVKDSFPDAVTEVKLRYPLTEDVILSGQIDLLSVTKEVARVADWKTGRKDSDYSHQLRAYAALIFLDDPTIKQVTSTALWVRDGEIENFTLARDDAKEWVAELVRRVVHWDGVWHPGQHCKYCKRSHECAAANAMTRRDVAALLDRDIDAVAAALAVMAPEEIIALNQKVDIVGVYVKRLHEAIKKHVEQNGTVTANGMKLEIVTENHRELDAAKALPVLQQSGLTGDEIGSCTRVSISKIEKIVSTKAGRGRGASAVRALSERLNAAEALSTTVVCKLQERRV